MLSQVSRSVVQGLREVEHCIDAVDDNVRVFLHQVFQPTPAQLVQRIMRAATEIFTTACVMVGSCIEVALIIQMVRYIWLASPLVKMLLTGNSSERDSNFEQFQAKGESYIHNITVAMAINCMFASGWFWIAGLVSDDVISMLRGSLFFTTGAIFLRSLYDGNL